MNWRYQKTQIADQVLKFCYLDGDDNLLSFRDVVELWADTHQDGSLFRAFHCQVLTDISFDAYKWETPCVDSSCFTRPFEFVVLNAPRLDRPQDPAAFKNQFDLADESQSIIEFPNIGRNAILVVPTPSGTEVNHCHLASFLRTCSATDESLLWKQVGQSMLDRASRVPVWLSTAGGGVPWLHIRLDDRPKYYGHKAYKSN